MRSTTRRVKPVITIREFDLVGILNVGFKQFDSSQGSTKFEILLQIVLEVGSEEVFE